MAIERCPVSTTEGTIIRITVKEVGEEKFFCSSFVFLSFLDCRKWLASRY